MTVKKTTPKKPVPKKPATKKVTSKRSTPVKPKVKKSPIKKSPVTSKIEGKKRPAKKTNTGQFKKGTAKTGGRVAGGKNKLPLELKKCIMKAFENKGSTEYLEKLADKRPDLFVGLLKAILPAEIKATLEHKGNVTYVVDTGVSHRPPIGVNNPKLKLIGGTPSSDE